jgi:hypothetical protein
LGCSQELDAGELLALPIDQPLLAKVEARIVTRLGRQLSPAANQLLLRLMATMRAFQRRNPPDGPHGAATSREDRAGGVQRFGRRTARTLPLAPPPQ